MSPVKQLLRDDRWTLAEIGTPTGPALLRFRAPVPDPSPAEEFVRLVTIVWAYADVGTGAMPDKAMSAEMRRFENHLCEAVQQDAFGILAAVLTFDGARQWVFYTRELQAFSHRLSTMPDYYGKPYPIELTTEHDPTWSYLRDKILHRVRPGQ